MLGRTALYSGLLGYGLTIAATAHFNPILLRLTPISACTLGNQMYGAVFISGPMNASLYMLVAISTSALILAIRRR